ncbi:MAG: TraR/DksA C4-type zinc finger protein [bacterium]|nr:TraR/DksA C4-type zinc finger protein [bacterium]
MDKKTKKQFEDLLKKLKQEKEKILAGFEEQLNSNDYNNSETSTYPYHSADIGTDAAMLERNTINMNKVMEEIREIDAALSKVSDNTYGICEICGDEITEKRLKAIPYVKLCLKCSDRNPKK